ACAAACPYGAPKLNQKAHKIQKCDACVDRTSIGLQPVCVEACVDRAIEFGDIEELRKKHGTLASVAPLPDPAKTKPNLVIKAGKTAQETGFEGGSVHKF
ncbi:4Fe-4S dicluster domain-containing protein, partial [Turicimonas muris]